MQSPSRTFLFFRSFAVISCQFYGSGPFAEFKEDPQMCNSRWHQPLKRCPFLSNSRHSSGLGRLPKASRSLQSPPLLRRYCRQVVPAYKKDVRERPPDSARGECQQNQAHPLRQAQDRLEDAITLGAMLEVDKRATRGGLPFLRMTRRWVLRGDVLAGADDFAA